MITPLSVQVSFTNETLKDVNVSSAVADARRCVMTLLDENDQVAALKMTPISASVVRIESEIPLTANYTLNIMGEAPIIPPDPSPLAANFAPPSVDTLKTYAQARDKLLVDLDMQDEQFVTPNELIGYFNEGVEEAESEILKIDEDYFLTSLPIATVAGQAVYDYPSNIYGYKVRDITYRNGSTIYSIPRFKRRDKFSKMAYAEQYGTSDDYQWFHTNSVGGQAKINFIPPVRETSIIPPNPAAFTPFTLWYIRHANRVPLIGEYVKNWEILVQSSAIDTGTDQIVVSGTYVTGDRVKLGATGSMPGGLVAGTVYYVIKGVGYIKLATTLQNAKAGTAIDITAVGAGLLTISIAATQAIVDNIIIDIPEFLKFVIQWAKCRCLEKEGDPRLAGAVEILKQQREQMVTTLTEAQQDDQNLVEADFSIYNEMS